MNANPSRSLTLGISAGALFDLALEQDVLRAHGIDAYRRYQLEHEADVLPPGPGLPVLELLQKEGRRSQRGVELVVLSQSPAAASRRVLESARQRDLELGRAAFTDGEPVTAYLKPFRVDLFLSADPEETAAALDAGIPAALVQAAGEQAESPPERIRVAVDGRSIALALQAEEAGEAARAADAGEERLPAVAVPRWVRAVAGLQRLGGPERRLVTTALVSCEEGPARERILAGLRKWEVELDQAFFAEAAAKADLLAALRPHIVFDAPGAGQADLRLQRTPEAGEAEKEPVPRFEGRGSSFSRLRLRS
jgi:5'-nucleotidase